MQVRDGSVLSQLPSCVSVQASGACMHWVKRDAQYCRAKREGTVTLEKVVKSTQLSYYSRACFAYLAPKGKQNWLTFQLFSQ